MGWTPDACLELIARFAALDPDRWRSLSREDTAGIAATWATAFDDAGVPYYGELDIERMWKRGSRWWYEQDTPPRMNPGRLIRLTREEGQAERRRANLPMPMSIGEVAASAAMPPWFRELAEASTANWLDIRKQWRRDGVRPDERIDDERARVEEHLPEPPRRIVGARERRERHCQRRMLERGETPSMPCLCEHTDCYGGFLDGDEVGPPHSNPEYDGHGQTYRSVRRCPTCHDTLRMRGERV